MCNADWLRRRTPGSCEYFASNSGRDDGQHLRLIVHGEACICRVWGDHVAMETDKTHPPVASIVAMTIGSIRSIRGRSLAVDMRLVDSAWKVAAWKSHKLGDVVDEPGRVVVEVTGLYLESQQVTVQVRSQASSVQMDLCAGETLVLDALGSAAVEPSGWIERLRKDVRASRAPRQTPRRVAHAAVKSLQASAAWF